MGILSLPARAQKEVSDSIVEHLLKSYKYQEAKDFILSRIKQMSPENTDLCLYYQTKLSMALLRLRKIDSALIIARKALYLSTLSMDSSLIISAVKMAAYTYNNAGALDSAIFFTRQMLKYAEFHHDEKMIRNSLTSIATILSQNKQYQEALDYHRDAYLLSLKLCDSVNISIGQFNIGLMFLNLKQTDSCLFYLNKARIGAETSNHYDLLIGIYGTMADCYLLMNDDAGRKKYLLMANKIAEANENYQFVAMGYSNLLEGELQRSNYKQAIIYGEKAIENLNISPYPVLQMKVDSMMYVASKKSGNFAKAIEHFELFSNLKETIISERQHKQLNDLVVKYEVKTKDLMIANQQLEIERSRKNQQLLLFAMVVILLTFVGFVGFNIKSRRFRKKMYLKEKSLDSQREETTNWMQWKQLQNYPKDEFSENEIKNTEHPYKKDILDSDTLLFAELRDLFETQKLYLDPDINLKVVIRALGTNKKYLYEALSQNSEDNFRRFINRYRISEAKAIIKSKIEQNEELIMSQLYNLTGFNNHVSFYRAFSSITGLTTKQYVAEIRNEIKERKKEQKHK